jgi:hypothetical protein
MDIRLGIDGHGPDAHFPAGPDDPQGDLAPVGDEDFGEQSTPLFCTCRNTYQLSFNPVL